MTVLVLVVVLGFSTATHEGEDDKVDFQRSLSCRPQAAPRSMKVVVVVLIVVLGF